MDLAREINVCFLDSLPAEQISTYTRMGTQLTWRIAEDNPVNQRLASRLLEKRGHSVLVVANGLEALEAVEKERFDLVFMDVQMPVMDGFEATTSMRQRMRAGGTRLPPEGLTAPDIRGGWVKGVP